MDIERYIKKKKIFERQVEDKYICMKKKYPMLFFKSHYYRLVFPYPCLSFFLA
jgi:hypothetical protein